MKAKDIVLYFVLTMIIVSSIGVWLPFAIDFFAGSFKDETARSFPGNLLTYYLGIFTIATIDRMLRIFELDNYSHKKSEFLVLAFVILTVGFLTFMVFKNIHHNDYGAAWVWCIAPTVIAYIMWWISKWHTIESNPTNALGGNI